MNSSSASRVYNHSGSRDTQATSKLRAVVIGEPFVMNPLNNPFGYPLSPITPSDVLPYALLPICNTPLIDYILENFVGNGVSEVTILLNPGSTAKVQAHLSGTRTVRGKPWTSSDSMKVSVLECMRDMQKLSDAVNEIRQRNVVPQSGSFLIVPIDCISVFHNNLQDYFQKHLERVRTIGKYAATLLCTSSRHNLNATLHNVLVQGLEKYKEVKHLDDTGSPTSMRGSVDIEVEPIMDYDRRRYRTVPVHPKGHHTMFVLDSATGVVQYMARLEVGNEDGPEPPLIAFTRKTQLTVRMDLVPTALLFCCCEALALVEFHIRDIYSFLSMSLLGQAEVFGNVFGVLEVPTSHAIIEPVDSLSTYIVANLDVCARRLYPLTRDSLFAEAEAKYAMPSYCETVYIHTSAKALGPISGPNVVLGEDVVLPASVQLVGTVCGRGVTVAEGSSLTGCVVLDGAQIGKKCNLRNSVIGYNAVIGDGFELVGCIIGHNCVLDGSMHPSEGSAATANSNGATGTGLSLHNQLIVNTKSASFSPPRVKMGQIAQQCSRAQSDSNHLRNTGASGEDSQNPQSITDDALVGASEADRVIMARYKDPIAGTSLLFTEDAIAKVMTDDEAHSIEGEDDEFELFRSSVRKNVNIALQKPSHIEAATYDMSTICLSEGYGYPELCEVVTELLIEHLLHNYDGRGADAALKGACSLFAQWCRPFYNAFLSKNGQANPDAMVSTLEGLCVAVRDPTCVLHNHAPELLEIVYKGCDEELYYQRGYCIVNAQSLVAFDDAMTRRRQNLQRYAGFQIRKDIPMSLKKPNLSFLESDDSSDAFSRDSREEGKVLVAATCRSFIHDVNKFLMGTTTTLSRVAAHCDCPVSTNQGLPRNVNRPKLALISDSSEEEDEESD